MHVIDAVTSPTDDGVMHRVAILAFDGVQSLDVAGPAEVFAGVNTFLAESGGDASLGYDVTVVSLDGGHVATERALRLATDPITSLPNHLDTVVIPGGFSVWHLRDDERFVTALDDLLERSDRLLTVCSGAALAAATGALDGHRVTTHWARAERLAAEHPEIDVDADPIFIHSPAGDGRVDVWSSAGVTAGIDLCLAVVEHDHHTDVASEIGRWLVMYLRRPGGQSQFASPTWIRQAPPGPVQRAQASIVADPGADHRVAGLAQRVAMSARPFVRRFPAAVGLPPAMFASRVAVDAARHDLDRSTVTVDAIARRGGLGSAETLRRTLQRQLGVSPEAYRRRFTHLTPTPGSAAEHHTESTTP